MTEVLLKPNEYANLKNLKPQTVRKWLRNRFLIGKKYGRVWRIRPDAMPKETLRHI
jgi:hypothetical protein